MTLVSQDFYTDEADIMKPKTWALAVGLKAEKYISGYTASKGVEYAEEMEDSLKFSDYESAALARDLFSRFGCDDLQICWVERKPSRN